MGDVTLGDNASIWYNAVLRGDINRIIVGEHTNIQDNSVLHLADDFPCERGQLRDRRPFRHCSCLPHWRRMPDRHGRGDFGRRGSRRRNV